MKLVLKVVVVFIVVALLLLLVFAYLEKREDNSATAILDDLKNAGQQAVDGVGEFLEDSGIKEGAATLLEKGADLVGGQEETEPPEEDTGV